jgi:hypothetical protein
MKKFIIIFVFILFLTPIFSKTYLNINIPSWDKKEKQIWKVKFDDNGFISSFLYKDENNNEEKIFGTKDGNIYYIYELTKDKPLMYCKLSESSFEVYDSKNRLIDTIYETSDIDVSKLTSGCKTGTITLNKTEILFKDTEPALNGFDAKLYIFPLNGGLRRSFEFDDFIADNHGDFDVAYIKTNKTTYTVRTTYNERDPFFYYIDTNHTMPNSLIVQTYFYFFLQFNTPILPFIIGLPHEKPDDYTDWNVYYSDSYLTEGTVVFSYSNLATKDGLPWASSNGKGIGDKILFTANTKQVYTLSLLNGYQSTEKPYLYKQNSRIKKARMSSPVSNDSLIINIKDSQELQTFDIYNLWLSCKDDPVFIFEVLDIYPGSKYNDLCIQMMRLD